VTTDDWTVFLVIMGAVIVGIVLLWNSR